MHANAGARLRSEISLLPTHLLNSSTNLGGVENIDNPHCESPNQTNVVGENLEENSARNMNLGGAAAATGTEHEVDLVFSSIESAP